MASSNNIIKLKKDIRENLINTIKEQSIILIYANSRKTAELEEVYSYLKEMTKYDLKGYKISFSPEINRRISKKRIILMINNDEKSVCTYAKEVLALKQCYKFRGKYIDMKKIQLKGL